MILENEHCRVEIDETRGVVTCFYDRIGGLELIGEPRIGEPFRLLIPLQDRESNYILGREASVDEVRPGGHGVELHWNGPLAGEQGEYQVQVTLRLELIGAALQLRVKVVNRSDHEIAEVWYPLLGGMTGLGERGQTRMMIHPQGRGQLVPLFQEFPESMGVGGGGGNPFAEYYVRYHGQLAMPWISFFNQALGRGLYFACHDETPAFGIARFEMQPGIAHNSIGDNWPRPEEIEPGTPVGVTATWVRFPYLKPGGTFEGPPVVFRFHAGDWHEGARIYREWFDSRFSRVDPQASWLHREHVYQDIMCMLPEGDEFLRFVDIPQVAADGLKYDVRALIVSSFNLGGHDNNYPIYEPDPRLGTWDELREAVAACRQMGVRVFFFVNLQPVHLDLDWYHEELHRYMSMDRWGVMPGGFGFGMGTLGARCGATCKKMGLASPGFPEFRRIIVDQVRRLAEIGADGVHFDKLGSHHDLDFNPGLTLGPALATGEGILSALRETLDVCRRINPEFQISTEDWWDRLLEFTDVAWAWHCELDHTSSMSYTFPQWKPMMPVVQPFDYNPVNNATRFGYQIMVGAARYSRSMDDPPMRPLSRYLQEVNRIRRRLQDTIYYGEFLDVLEVEVDTHDEVKYNTHRNRETGARACVLVNLGHEPREATVAFEGNPAGKVSLHEPFEGIRQAVLPVTVSIAPRRLVVVEEV